MKRATHPAIIPDPVVSVSEPYGLWLLTCSACGDLSDFAGRPGDDLTNRMVRARLQREAWRHAEDVHDGLVIREGWA